VLLLVPVDPEWPVQISILYHFLDKVREEYKKRKLMVEVTVKYYEIFKGSNFSTTIQKAETELTPEMLANGSWKSLTFKPYNFEALGIQPLRGHLHPLMKVRAEYRQVKIVIKQQI
jgi:phenylalanyl-tRNA synthetase alpha chain